MSLYAVTMLILCVGTFLSLNRYLETALKKRNPSGKLAPVLALVLVLGIWLVHDTGWRWYSHEAKGYKRFRHLVGDWQAGKKAAVEKELDYLSMSDLDPPEDDRADW